MAKKKSKDTQEIKKLKGKVKELEEAWKRALADYANLEKRFEKEKKTLVDFSNAQLLDKILPTLDELQFCSRHIKDKGLEIVLSKFWEVFKSEGIAEIKVKGEEFDPERMDAMEMVKGPKNKVIGVVLKGYMLGEKVLRPAKVKVGEGKIAVEKKKVKKAERERLRGEYV